MVLAARRARRAPRLRPRAPGARGRDGARAWRSSACARWPRSSPSCCGEPVPEAPPVAADERLAGCWPGAARSASRRSTSPTCAAWPTPSTPPRSPPPAGTPCCCRAPRAPARPASPSASPGCCPTSAPRSRSSSPPCTRWPASSSRATALITRPPFSAPHHDASKSSLIGGRQRPGATRRDQPRPRRRAVPRRVPALPQRHHRGAAPAARERRHHRRPRRGVGHPARARHARAGLQPVPVRRLDAPTPARTAAAARPPSCATTATSSPARSPTGSTSPATSGRCASDQHDPFAPPETVGRGPGAGRARPGPASSSATPTAAGGSTPTCPSPFLRDRWPLSEAGQRMVDQRPLRRPAQQPRCRPGPAAGLDAGRPRLGGRGPRRRAGRGPGRGRAAAAQGRAARRAPRRRGGRPDERAPSDDRLARVALSRLGEPGETRMTGLVAELGAVAAARPAARRARPRRPADRRRRPPGRARPRPRARAGRRGSGCASSCPATTSGPTQLDDLAGAGALHDRGGVPIGLWVKGPLRLDELAASRRGGRLPRRHRLRRRGRQRDRGRRRARPATWSSPGGAFGIDRAAHRGAVVDRRADGRRAWPAAPTGSTRPPTRRCSSTSPATGAIVSEARAGLRAPPDPLPGPQPADRRADRAARSWSRRRRAAAPSTPPTGPAGSTGRYGRARAGHQRRRPPGVHEQLRTGAMPWSPAAPTSSSWSAPSGEHLVERAAGAEHRPRPADPAPAAGARRRPGRQRRRRPTRSPGPPGSALREVHGGAGRARGGRPRRAGDHDGWRLTALARPEPTAGLARRTLAGDPTIAG